MSNAIDYFSYASPFTKLRTPVVVRARHKMYQKFLDSCNPNGQDEVLDLGVTPDTKLDENNFFEKQYPYKDKITIASIEDCAFLVEKYGLKGFVQNHPKEALPFSNKQFDILYCSAVLEHVGTREDQKFFLEECQRVADKIFITTPNRYFPVEMHTFIPFLHWLPWNVFQKIVRVLKGDFWADINNLNLLSTHDIRKMFVDNELVVSSIRTMGIKSNLLITKRPD